METKIDLKVEITKSGSPTLKVFHNDKEYYLHSKYNPIREAETWVKEYYEQGKMVILVGLGLGYCGRELLKFISPEDRILIIEPYKEIIDIAKDNNLKDLLDDDRVFICLESDKERLGKILRILIQGQFLKDSKIMVAPNYEKICSIGLIINKLKKAFVDYSVDINTKLKQATGWQENYLRNIQYAVQSCPITAFENQLNFPVVIVSAGPSLEKELDQLKEIYDHALIISSGTATTVLIKNNIKPHIIVSIDGHMANYNHFKEIDYTGIPLFYSPNSHYKIVEKHKGSKIIFQWSGIEVCEWYDDIIGFKTGIIKVGPSVANFALDIACKMTSGPICFVGQDLAYVGGFSHAEGNINRTNIDTLQSAALMPVESNDGSKLYTDYAFTLMREWFENYLYANPRGNVFNATLTGAKINGTEVMAFAKFVAKFCNKSIDAKQFINNVISDWEEEHNDSKIQTNEIFKEMLVCLNKIIELTKKAKNLSEKLLNKIKNNDNKGINTILAKLSAIDDKIMQLKDKDGLLYFTIQTVVDILLFWDEEDKDEHKKRIKIAEKSDFFYCKLYEMSNKVKQTLNDIYLGGTHGTSDE